MTSNGGSTKYSETIFNEDYPKRGAFGRAMDYFSSGAQNEANHLPQIQGELQLSSKDLM